MLSASPDSMVERSQVREPSGFDVPAVLIVALVAMRNVAAWPAASGTSLLVMWPSWFGVHSPVVPSPGGVVSVVVPASVSAAPQVPSALQKCEGQSLSIVHTVPLEPPQAATAMLHCSANNRVIDSDIAGTLRPGSGPVKPLLAVQQKHGLQCSNRAARVGPWHRS